MVFVFAVFITLTFLDFKEMGVGLAVAVLIDATIIRGVLLPASMKLLGDWNWYLPRWVLLKRPALANAQRPARRGGSAGRACCRPRARRRAGGRRAFRPRLDDQAVGSSPAASSGEIVRNSSSTTPARSSRRSARGLLAQHGAHTVLAAQA